MIVETEVAVLVVEGTEENRTLGADDEMDVDGESDREPEGLGWRSVDVGSVVCAGGSGVAQALRRSPNLYVLD